MFHGKRYPYLFAIKELTTSGEIGVLCVVTLILLQFAVWFDAFRDYRFIYLLLWVSIFYIPFTDIHPSVHPSIFHITFLSQTSNICVFVTCCFFSVFFLSRVLLV